jgi:hypothetical protein
MTSKKSKYFIDKYALLSEVGGQTTAANSGDHDGGRMT